MGLPIPPHPPRSKEQPHSRQWSYSETRGTAGSRLDSSIGMSCKVTRSSRDPRKTIYKKGLTGVLGTQGLSSTSPVTLRVPPNPVSPAVNPLPHLETRQHTRGQVPCFSSHRNLLRKHLGTGQSQKSSSSVLQPPRCSWQLSPDVQATERKQQEPSDWPGWAGAGMGTRSSPMSVALTFISAKYCIPLEICQAKEMRSPIVSTRSSGWSRELELRLPPLPT